MRTRSYSHYNDQDLLHRLTTLVADERASSAEVVACIAEVEKRGLWRAQGYDSMHAYCVHKLELSDDAAFKRISAARVALEFPPFLDALADGRLHLTAVNLLAGHLRPENAAELLAAAEHQTVAAIKLLIAERFPKPDLPTRVDPLAGVSPCQTSLVSKPVDVTTAELVSKPVEAPVPHPRVAPLSPGRFALQGTMSENMYEKLRYAQALLGHAVPSGDVMEVLERALDALIALAEKRKFAVTSRSGPQRSSADPRHIPAHVKRAVLERDGGECTFVGENGHRCGSGKRLEFDHVDPVARGGAATVDGVRLRCRAHNQYEAECIFGAGFMETRREAARAAAAEKRARDAAEKAIERDPDRSVVPWLRGLGCHLQDAREAAAYCATMPPEAMMKDRIRAALGFLSARRGLVKTAVSSA